MCLPICQRGKNYFAGPVTSTLQNDRCEPFHKCPAGTKTVAEAHTHASVGGTFSSNDVARAKFLGLPSYVADELGEILVYDPNLPGNDTQRQQWLCWMTSSGLVCE
jgi:hypothetical protein